MLEIVPPSFGVFKIEQRLSRLAEERSIGSGQVEGACKHMIGKRLKQTWAEWKVRNLNRMAIICAVRYGEQWKNYWKQAM